MSLLLRKEVDKLKQTVKERDDYIASLPSLDEVEQSEKRHAALRAANDELKAHIAMQDAKIVKAKQFIREHGNVIKDKQEQLERVERDLEQARAEFEHYKRETRDVGTLMERCEENAKLRADLDTHRKMLAAMADRERQLQLKHDEQQAGVKHSLQAQIDTNKELRDQMAAKERQAADVDKALREMRERHEALRVENASVRDKLTTMEILVNADSLKMLQMLFSELNSSTADLDNLVKHCVSLYKGEQVDVCDLLGNGAAYHEASASCAHLISDMMTLSDRDYVHSIINSDFLVNKASQLKEVRKKITSVRQMVSDYYAEKVGSNISCIQQ